jgi:hypothetical protein
VPIALKVFVRRSMEGEIGPTLCCVEWVRTKRSESYGVGGQLGNTAHGVDEVDESVEISGEKRHSLQFFDLLGGRGGLGRERREGKVS